jgi:hypothetical protein
MSRQPSVRIASSVRSQGSSPPRQACRATSPIPGAAAPGRRPAASPRVKQRPVDGPSSLLPAAELPLPRRTGRKQAPNRQIPSRAARSICQDFSRHKRCRGGRFAPASDQVSMTGELLDCHPVSTFVERVRSGDRRRALRGTLQTECKRPRFARSVCPPLATEPPSRCHDRLGRRKAPRAR